MNTIGVILAGGQSSRFLGEDKSWIQWNGSPLIQHVIERVLPEIDQLIISANQNLEKYKALGFPVVCDDEDKHLGPLAGILAVMNYLIKQTANIDNTNLLTAPCDMPLLPRNLKTLLNHPARKQQLCVARDAQRIQPLVALIPLSLHPHLKQFLDNGNRKSEQWILSTDPKIIDLKEFNNCFYNINSHNELENLENTSKDLAN